MYKSAHKQDAMSLGRRLSLVVTLLVITSLNSIQCAMNEIRIGVLIKHRGLEEPLNKTIEMLNADTSVLYTTRLTAIVELIETENSYQASSAVCKLLSQGVWAIIGPQSISLTPIIQSITSHHQIPLILINWQPYSMYKDPNRDNNPTNERYSKDIDDIPSLYNYTLNLYPMADQLSRAYADIIRYKEWKTFSLVFDSSENFVLVKDILEMSMSDSNINLQKINLATEIPEPREGDTGVYEENGELKTTPNGVRHLKYCNLEADSIDMSYRKLMKDLRKRGVENFVLSMSLDKICKVLREAANVGLLTFYNDFVIANLDTHLLNLTQLQPLTTNISGYSLLDPDGQPINFNLPKKYLGKRPTEIPKKLLSTEYSMMSDAVSLIAYSLDELLKETNMGRKLSPPMVDCSANAPWPYGSMLMDIFKRSERYGGYTGNIKFDEFGQRVDFNLEYILHKNNTFKKVGTWSLSEKFTDKSKSSFDFGLQAIKNKTLKVTVARTDPYVMLKKDHADRQGNDRYEGYCIDLMDKLAKKLSFKYILKEVSDGQYGKIQNGSWNGMIRELLDWQADLAIVDLTITKERQSAVDFTHPFMTLGIAIMYKKPKLEEAEMYSFLMPLSKEVWLSMGSAYLAISLALWLIARLSPTEWKNPHPCVDNPDELDLENEIHSIGASLWFNIGSLMQQGSDLAPRSASVRAIASVWFFFTLILISSYTANFAAFLTASRMQSPIESAEDLSKQTRIDYGCKDGGSTQAFFATSNHSTYRRMWNFMESRKHQGVFPKDNSKGAAMVKRGNFAFLMESTSIDYMIQRDCELTQIGGLLDHKGYGIALRKRSPFRAPLSKSIVELNEEGDLQDLKTKWWSMNKTYCVEEKDSALATSELGIDKVGGVFILLAYGLCIAFNTALLEFIWKSLKTSKDQRDTIKKMLWREILRILRCGTSKRPAADPTYIRTSSHPSMNNSRVSV